MHVMINKIVNVTTNVIMILKLNVVVNAVVIVTKIEMLNVMNKEVMTKMT